MGVISLLDDALVVAGLIALGVWEQTRQRNARARAHRKARDMRRFARTIRPPGGWPRLPPGCCPNNTPLVQASDATGNAGLSLRAVDLPQRHAPLPSMGCRRLCRTALALFQVAGPASFDPPFPTID
eukprot:g11525.t1